MSIKRKAGTDDRPSNKRNRVSDVGDAADQRLGGYEIKSRVDPITGQRGAFPGLEESRDDKAMFYGPASDGMEYLKMVRAEAQNVPSMLATASRLQNRHEWQDGGYQARHNVTSARFWADEAIIADPTEDLYDDWVEDEENYEEKDPQDAYYDALLARFEALRGRLQQKPPTTSDSGSISPQVRNSTYAGATYKQWYHALTHTQPVPHYLAGLSQQQVITGLDRLETVLSKRNLDHSLWRSNLGAWAWSLLARCRDRTELDGDDIGVLRSLAKRAQQIDRRLRAIPAGHAQSNQWEEDVEDGPEVEDEQTGPIREIESKGEIENSSANPQDLEAARARLLGLVDSRDDQSSPIARSESDRNSLQPTLMLLDSIVTVVGELYGQRDLLEQRAAW